MACGMGVAQMAHGAATVVFDSTAQKLFELPNSLTISQIFARTGRGEYLRDRSEEHTSELQSLMRISYAVFCLKKKTTICNNHSSTTTNNTQVSQSMIRPQQINN